MTKSQLEAELGALHMRQLVQGLAIEELMRNISAPDVAVYLGRLSARLDEEMRRLGRPLETDEDEAMTSELVRILGATVVAPTTDELSKVPHRKGQPH